MSANQCLNIASASVKALEQVSSTWPEATAEDLKQVAQVIMVTAPALVQTDRCVERNALELITYLAEVNAIPAWVG